MRTGAFADGKKLGIGAFCTLAGDLISSASLVARQQIVSSTTWVLLALYLYLYSLYNLLETRDY